MLVHLTSHLFGVRTCAGCGEQASCIEFQVQVENGLASTDPTCMRCIALGCSIDVLMEQPDLRPGAQAPNRAMKRRSRKQELDIAEKTGGKRHKASGAIAGLKGDARKKGIYRAEGKLCTNKSFSLSREILDKIQSEASYPEVPVVVVTFIDKVTLQEKDCWVVIPWKDFEEKIANVTSHDNSGSASKLRG